MYDIRFGGKGNLAQVFDDPVCLMTNLQIFCRESSFANLFRGLASFTGISNKFVFTLTAEQCSDNLYAGTNVSLSREKKAICM